MRTVDLPPAERMVYRTIWTRLLAATDILLVSPQRPDGDSLGSILGLRAALASMGKSATAFCPDPSPPTFDLLPGIHALAVGFDALRERTFDAIVIADAGDLAVTGIGDALPYWRHQGTMCIVLDHHTTNTRYGDCNAVIPTAASTTEVILRMLTVHGVALTPAIATCLLLGLVTDTDGFTNPATTPSAIASAAVLTAAGAPLGSILRAVYRTKPIAALQLWGRALERLHVHPRWDIATAILVPSDFMECRDGVDQSDGLSNFLQNVIPSRAILVLKDDGSGTVRGSLRTQRDDVDLGRLATHLGGGGHRKASGFGIPGKLVHDGHLWKVV